MERKTGKEIKEKGKNQRKNELEIFKRKEEKEEKKKKHNT